MFKILNVLCLFIYKCLTLVKSNENAFPKNQEYHVMTGSQMYMSTLLGTICNLELDKGCNLMSCSKPNSSSWIGKIGDNDKKCNVYDFARFHVSLRIYCLRADSALVSYRL
ncbi:hypothetical protein C0J52_10834 [Blattella germanica]|nr:hypothetical protein C0J52_10834 [Blattella germanica]